MHVLATVLCVPALVGLRALAGARTRGRTLPSPLGEVLAELEEIV